MLTRKAKIFSTRQGVSDMSLTDDQLNTFYQTLVRAHSNAVDGISTSPRSSDAVASSIAKSESREFQLKDITLLLEMMRYINEARLSLEKYGYVGFPQLKDLKEIFRRQTANGDLNEKTAQFKELCEETIRTRLSECRQVLYDLIEANNAQGICDTIDFWVKNLYVDRIPLSIILTKYINQLSNRDSGDLVLQSLFIARKNYSPPRFGQVALDLSPRFLAAMRESRANLTSQSAPCSPTTHSDAPKTLHPVSRSLPCSPHKAKEEEHEVETKRESLKALVDRMQELHIATSTESDTQTSSTVTSAASSIDEEMISPPPPPTPDPAATTTSSTPYIPSLKTHFDKKGWHAADQSRCEDTSKQSHKKQGKRHKLSSNSF